MNPKGARSAREGKVTPMPAQHPNNAPPAQPAFIRTPTGPRAVSVPGTSTELAERIDEAETLLFYCLKELGFYAEMLAARAVELGDMRSAIRARLVAADALSRGGQLAEAFTRQTVLHRQAADWPALQRRCGVALAATADRLGDRQESIRLIAEATLNWPESDEPVWRAEALMVFALMSITHKGVDYNFARYAVDAVREHGTPLLLSVTLANFAETAAECGDLEVAADFAASTRQVLDSHPEVTVTLTLASLGIVTVALGDPQSARDVLNQAIALDAELGCSDILGDPWLTMSQVLLLTGDYSGALQVLDVVRRPPWSARSVWTRSRELKFRATALAGLQRWQEAYAALLDHVELYESMRSIDSDRLTAESETRRLADEERLRAQRFEQLALTDALTGLPNRRQVDDWLQNRSPADLHIGIVDLDHFKRVNDIFSHAAGDLVLRRVADALKEAMAVLGDRGEGWVGRLGGEEFIVAWSGVQQSSVREYADQLLDRVRNLHFGEIEKDLVVTASLGIAFSRAGVPGSMLLAEADAALYVAKGNGRDQVVFHSENDAAAPHPDSLDRRAIRDQPVSRS
jgi:two-component system cell cycle response regulator